ncbi:MAG: SIMPL domain-containing protein, partial [Candidatus Kapaibacterium sp.]
MKSTMKHTSKYLVFGLLAVFAFFSLVPVNPATAQQRSITVIGEGTARATPETVSLSLSVSSQDATATTVFAKHNVEIARLKKALIDAGVNAKDITEGSLAMNPTYDYSQPGVAP